MAATVHALDLLSRPLSGDEVPSVCVLHGDEPFQNRQALRWLRQAVLGDDEGEFSYHAVEGASATLSDVLDELATVALFGSGRRFVLVEEADAFVSEHRQKLDEYAARPHRKGTLVLSVTSWPKNTRLAKVVAASGMTIECTEVKPARLASWLRQWSKSTYGSPLDSDAAALLLDIVGAELGLLDQELAKLASYAGERAIITAEMVEELVGGWRTKTIWNLLDAALDGNSADALLQLDRLIHAGEAPIALMGQLSSTLRRFAVATRIVQEAQRQRQRMGLRDALQQAGMRPFVLAKSETQLRRLGRIRAGKLLDWLLETDLALKGESSRGPRARIALEQLIVRLAAPAASPARGTRKPASAAHP